MHHQKTKSSKKSKKEFTIQDFQNRYKFNYLTDSLGEGGEGSVFKAYDEKRSFHVAIKISKVDPKKKTIRLHDQVKMVKEQLEEHTNIAYYEKCYTYAWLDGIYDFGILQYYKDGNLSQLLTKQKISLAQKQSILMQILEGIRFLHNEDIIHRDLKPQNILMVRHDEEYVPKITDFGISKELDDDMGSVFNNSLAGYGTLLYSSPEQLYGFKIRKNTDLWSFGVIAFQTLTGQLPFTTGKFASNTEAGRKELFDQINSRQLPDITPQIPEPWQTLIRHCLVTDTALRIKNVEEAKDILMGNDGGRDAARHVSTENEKNHEPDDTTLTDPIPKKIKTQPQPKQPAPAVPIIIKPRPYRKPIWPYAVSILAVMIMIAVLSLKLLSTPENDLWSDMVNKVSNFIKINSRQTQDEIPQPVDTLEIKMILVEGGTFTIGCTGEQGDECLDDEKPAHQVTVSDFNIGIYEVTQAQWKAVMGNDHNPSYFKGNNLPVERVSWNDTKEFIERLNAATGKQYRLPTEAEWEYAARGGVKSQGYKYAGSNNINDVAWYDENSGRTTQPVGSKSPNELGIYDMSGNVREWCADWYGDYPFQAQQNPEGTSNGGANRVHRGGGMFGSATNCRVSNRRSDAPDGSGNNLGFRLVHP